MPGEGETPSPVPSPRGDTPTVHCPGIGPRRRTGSGLIPPLQVPGAPPEKRRQRRSRGPGFLLNIATHCPCPREGAGEERAARAGWGMPVRNFRASFCPGRGRPPPRSPPPVAISTTVHCPGSSRGRTGSGAALPTLPGKPVATPLPGLGFPPGIASTALAPGRGRGGAGEGLLGVLLSGEGKPPPRSPPPVTIPPRSTVWGDPGERAGFRLTPEPHLTPQGNRRRHHLPWPGFPPGIAMTALAPGRGRGRSAQRGRGRGCRRTAYEYPSVRLQRGIYGYPPVGREKTHPPWRYPHGPPPRGIPEKNRVLATPAPPRETLARAVPRPLPKTGSPLSRP